MHKRPWTLWFWNTEKPSKTYRSQALWKFTVIMVKPHRSLSLISSTRRNYRSQVVKSSRFQGMSDARAPPDTAEHNGRTFSSWIRRLRVVVRLRLWELSALTQITLGLTLPAGYPVATFAAWSAIRTPNKPCTKHLHRATKALHRWFRAAPVISSFWAACTTINRAESSNSLWAKGTKLSDLRVSCATSEH